MGQEINQESGEISRPLLSKVQGNGGSSVTKELVFCTLVAVSGSCVFGSAVGYSSPTQSAIMEELPLSVAEFSVFGSILTIGAMIGAIMSGKIADFIDRRGTMGFSELLCITGWLTIAFSKMYRWLYIGRLLVGCGMGIISYVENDVKIVLQSIDAVWFGFRNYSITFSICRLVFYSKIPSMVDGGKIKMRNWEMAKLGRWKEGEAALQLVRGEKADISEESSETRQLAWRSRLSNSKNFSHLRIVKDEAIEW